MIEKTKLRIGTRSSKEPITAPRNGFDQTGVSKGFPQSVDVVSKIVFFNNSVRPDRRDKVVLLNQVTGPGREHAKRIEHFRAQPYRASVAQKTPLVYL